VLHHADKPQLYHCLPDNTSISWAVTFWKGVWKPLAAISFAATFSASVFHYIGVGPNCVDYEDNHPPQDEETPQ